MVTFRNNNNNRRSRFRTHDRSFKRNEDSSKFKTDFSSHANFVRNSPGRNNHNASKLIEKYNNLAREALANEDKILSESYFQYADHFTRVLTEQEKNRQVKTDNNFNKKINQNNQETKALNSDNQETKALNSEEKKIDTKKVANI
jgi:hypothetical protein|tara:strand:- start:449 stop:883 length:435 start_codon:yes stop_codon:yes gene_type:complete